MPTNTWGDLADTKPVILPQACACQSIDYGLLSFSPILGWRPRIIRISHGKNGMLKLMVSIFFGFSAGIGSFTKSTKLRWDANHWLLMSTLFWLRHPEHDLTRDDISTNSADSRIGAFSQTKISCRHLCDYYRHPVSSMWITNGVFCHTWEAWQLNLLIGKK